MARDDGGPAYPVVGAPGAPEDYPGMSLRDYFAGQALAGMLATYGADPPLDAPLNEIAQDAYRQADEMLRARNE